MDGSVSIGCALGAVPTLHCKRSAGALQDCGMAGQLDRSTSLHGCDTETNA